MMKKFIAIVMCIMLVCSVITTVSADETTEYITFDLREAGANAQIFGTQATAEAIAQIQSAIPTVSDTPVEYYSAYPTKKVDSTNIPGIRVVQVLNKDAFDAQKTADGLIYDMNNEIPFKILTDENASNGILIGTSNGNEQVLTLNAEKEMNMLYIYYTTTPSSKIANITITYTDNSTDNKSFEIKGAEWNEANITTGYWGKKFKLFYNINHSLATNDDSVAVSAATAAADAERHPNIAAIELNSTKKVKSIAFKLSDGWITAAIIGITGRAATAEEIASGATTMNLAALKAKYADASAVTMANCNDVSTLLAEINDEFVPVEDAEYVASIRAAVEAIFAQVDETVAKYDILEISKNVPLAANVGDTTKVIGIQHEFDDPALDTDNGNDQYAFNIAALNYKAVKGYTFSNDNIPFKIEADSNGYYGRKITGKANPAAELTGTYELTIPEGKKYTKISFVAPASGTETQNRDDVSYKLVYDDGTANGKTVIYNTSQIQWNTVAREENKTSLVNDPNASYILYETDTNNRNNTYNWLTYDYSAGKYLSVNDAFLNTYVPVYNLPVDPTKTLKKVVITCTPVWRANTILAATAHKAVLSDVIDTLEVTAETYKDVSVMIEELPEGDLTPAQEEKLEVIKKQIKFYVQDYVPFEIPENVFNGKVFGTDVAKADVKLEDYISVNDTVGDSCILDKVKWDADKKEGLIYSANDIPFNVNTDKGLLFGNHSQEIVRIDIPEGNYDSISALFAFSNVDSGAFKMRAIYDDGNETVDSNWDPANYGHCNGNFETQTKTDKKEADSYVVISGGGTLRDDNDPDRFTTFGARYYFPVMTLDTDIEKTLVAVEFTNTRNNVNGAILGVTGSRNDSTHKTLTRVFNSLMNSFTDAELEAAHSAYVNSYDTGLYTNKTYGLEPMDVIYLKHSNNTLSGKVMSYVNTDNEYTVVALVLNADGSFDRVEIMGNGTANLSAHDFSETIVLEEGQKINVLLWENFATLKPYMTAKVVK